MKRNLKYGQWLVFWLMACLPFAIMASAVAPRLPAQDFLFTEPEFETMHDPGRAIDERPITAIVQDQRGLIWIGTQDGLVRYDGYRYRKFNYKASDPSSLAGDYVFSLAVAKDGRLWVGTLSDGVSVFDPASERFEHFRHDQNIPHSLGDGTISALADDARGGMWIATDQGLDHLAAGGKRFVHFRHGSDPHTLLDDKVRSLLQDKAGNLWVGSNSGLQRLSRNSDHFETVLDARNVLALFQAQDGKLWLGTREHGVAWLMPGPPNLPNPPEAHWLPLAQLGHSWITGIAQVNADQIWLSSYGGGMMVIAASDGHVLQILRHDPAMPGSLAFDTIKPLLMDRAGWLWVGTWGAGLQRMNANNTMVRLLRHNPKKPNSLSQSNINSILELADGRLLFGGANGIDIVDRQSGLIGGYRGQGQPGTLPKSAVQALAQTGDGSIWAGTRQGGLVRQLPGTAEWIAVPGLSSSFVRRIFVSRNDSLWVGTDRGVASMQPDANTVNEATRGAAGKQSAGQAQSPGRFEMLLTEQGNVMQETVSSMVEDGQGRIWIGTNNGLWVHEPGRPGLISIPVAPNRPGGLTSGYIGGLLHDSHGRLWVSTDKGLDRLQSWNGKQSEFEHASALFGDNADGTGANLMEDSQGRIWNEESVIDPARRQISKLNPVDGMDVGPRWIGAHAQTRDGLLLFGGAKGVVIIDPAQFRPYDYAPPLVVTELKINGKAAAPAWLAHALPDTAARLTLDPMQRNFALEFAALDYSEPKNNRYQYRLQGYEKEWINTDADHRTAAYGNLWPGSYTLQVRGSNRIGQWSAHELRIPVRVLPAWWQTWWFGLALLLAATGLVASLVQVRTGYLRLRQRELEQRVDERTSQLRQKQIELVQSNHELNHANEALNESNLALNDANAELVLSVETLRQLGDIGREITANLDAEIVFRSLYLYVGGLLNAPTMTIYRMNAAATALDAVFGRDDDQAMPMRRIALDSPTSNAARAVRERQELLLHYDPQDYSTHIPGTRHMLTALFSPLIVDDKVLGAMSIQSDKQNAYGERERLIFRTLTAYGAIALANAAALTALHQAQGQLVQQEKMASLGGLVAGIAHEINTPLGTALVAMSGAENAWQTLQDAVASGRLSKSVLDASTTEGMEYTALALKTATRAAELIALFKTISVNADSDRPMEIELAGYLDEVATLVRSQLVQNGSKLEVAAPAGLSIHVVPEALTEALSRILVNTLDHAFAGGRTGTLRIHAQAGGEGGDEVIINLSDNGHGIAPEDLPKVFDPFFTTKSGMHGHVGLGLHVAWNHVTQRLKGQIQITSTLGEGTSVAIWLKRHGTAQKEGE